ncbi:MAG: extracellular solute-binding protein [Chitinispirillia bacterium]|nr:extracellular solute-binding protein [Chitinispirillia bacterium]MCL2242632.1 extracellular solute-binding protein [Chitinispirillia bacterium]
MKKFCSIAALVLAVSLTLAAVSGCGPQKPKLYVYNWIQYIPDDVIMEFEKRFDVKVIYDMFSTNEEMYTKLRVGGGRYDIVVPSGDHVSIMISQGMLQPVNKDLVPNLKHLDPVLTSRVEYDPGMKYSVPYAAGMSGISVNTEHVTGDIDNSWRIFETPEFKGRMTLLDDMREVLGAALRTLGYSVNSKSQAELDQAKELVLKWKEGIVKFDSEAFGKSFAAGEFWVVQGYAENVFLELDDGAKEHAKFFIPKEGGPMYMDNMVILKDARNVELAYKFMNFIHEPEVYAKIMDYLGTPSMNMAAREHMEVTPYYQIEDMANSEFKEDLGEHLEMYNKIWQEIRVGK